MSCRFSSRNIDQMDVRELDEFGATLTETLREIKSRMVSHVPLRNSPVPPLFACYFGSKFSSDSVLLIPN